MSESDSYLNGSEQFLLISGAIGAASACLAMILQCVLRSRCSTIKCCGVECQRQVIDISAADAVVTSSV